MANAHATLASMMHRTVFGASVLGDLPNEAKGCFALRQTSSPSAFSLLHIAGSTVILLHIPYTAIF